MILCFGPSNGKIKLFGQTINVNTDYIDHF